MIKKSSLILVALVCLQLASGRVVHKPVQESPIDEPAPEQPPIEEPVPPIDESLPESDGISVGKIAGHAKSHGTGNSSAVGKVVGVHGDKKTAGELGVNTESIRKGKAMSLGKMVAVATKDNTKVSTLMKSMTNGDANAGAHGTGVAIGNVSKSVGESASASKSSGKGSSNSAIKTISKNAPVPGLLGKPVHNHLTK